MTGGTDGYLRRPRRDGPCRRLGRRAGIEERSPTAPWSARRSPMASRRSRDLPGGDDTAAMLECLRVLGSRRSRVDAGGRRRRRRTWRHAAARPADAAARGWPGRRRGSSPRWPRSARAVRRSTAIRRCERGRWGRCTTHSSHARGHRPPARGAGTPAGRRSPDRPPVRTRGGPRRHQQPVHHRVDADRAVPARWAPHRSHDAHWCRGRTSTSPAR